MTALFFSTSTNIRVTTVSAPAAATTAATAATAIVTECSLAHAVIKPSKSSTPVFQHLRTFFFLSCHFLFFYFYTAPTHFSVLLSPPSSLLPPQPQNILLTSLSPPGDIKIVDFGLARRLGAVGELREILGTPEYVGKVAFAGKFRRLDQGWANFGCKNVSYGGRSRNRLKDCSGDPPHRRTECISWDMEKMNKMKLKFR